jgi:hypothetical protein
MVGGDADPPPHLGRDPGQGADCCVVGRHALDDLEIHANVDECWERLQRVGDPPESKQAIHTVVVCGRSSYGKGDGDSEDASNVLRADVRGERLDLPPARRVGVAEGDVGEAEDEACNFRGDLAASEAESSHRGELWDLKTVRGTVDRDFDLADQMRIDHVAEFDGQFLEARYIARGCRVFGKRALLLVCVRRYCVSAFRLVICRCEGRCVLSRWASGGCGSRRRFGTKGVHLFEKLRRR